MSDSQTDALDAGGQRLNALIRDVYSRAPEARDELAWIFQRDRRTALELEDRSSGVATRVRRQDETLEALQARIRRTLTNIAEVKATSKKLVSLGEGLVAEVGRYGRLTNEFQDVIQNVTNGHRMQVDPDHLQHLQRRLAQLVEDVDGNERQTRNWLDDLDGASQDVRGVLAELYEAGDEGRKVVHAINESIDISYEQMRVQAMATGILTETKLEDSPFVLGAAANQNGTAPSVPEEHVVEAAQNLETSVNRASISARSTHEALETAAGTAQSVNATVSGEQSWMVELALRQSVQARDSGSAVHQKMRNLSQTLQEAQNILSQIVRAAYDGQIYGQGFRQLESYFFETNGIIALATQFEAELERATGPVSAASDTIENLARTISESVEANQGVRRQVGQAVDESNASEARRRYATADELLALAPYSSSKELSAAIAAQIQVNPKLTAGITSGAGESPEIQRAHAVATTNRALVIHCFGDASASGKTSILGRPESTTTTPWMNRLVSAAVSSDLYYESVAGEPISKTPLFDPTPEVSSPSRAQTQVL